MFKLFTNTKYKNKDDSVQVLEKPLKNIIICLIALA